MRHIALVIADRPVASSGCGRSFILFPGWTDPRRYCRGRAYSTLTNSCGCVAAVISRCVASERSRLRSPRDARHARTSALQNIVFEFAEDAGIRWSTSQCSTILPASSSRKMSIPAQPWSPGQCWKQCKTTKLPSASTRLNSTVYPGMRSPCVW